MQDVDDCGVLSSGEFSYVHENSDKQNIDIKPTGSGFDVRGMRLGAKQYGR